VAQHGEFLGRVALAQAAGVFIEACGQDPVQAVLHHHAHDPGPLPAHSASRLVQAQLAGYCYNWSLREMVWQIRFNLMVKWFVGYPLGVSEPDHTSLERSEFWVCERQHRAFYDTGLCQIDADFPSERGQVQLGDTFAMRAHAGRERLIRLIRHICQWLLRALNQARPDLTVTIRMQRHREALFGVPQELDAYWLDTAGCAARWSSHGAGEAVFVGGGGRTAVFVGGGELVAVGSGAGVLLGGGGGGLVAVGGECGGGCGVGSGVSVGVGTGVSVGAGVSVGMAVGTITSGDRVRVGLGCGVSLGSGVSETIAVGVSVGGSAGPGVLVGPGVPLGPGVSLGAGVTEGDWAAAVRLGTTPALSGLLATNSRTVEASRSEGPAIV
jgi:hypothetical protein